MKYHSKISSNLTSCGKINSIDNAYSKINIINNTIVPA